MNDDFNLKELLPQSFSEWVGALVGAASFYFFLVIVLSFN